MCVRPLSYLRVFDTRRTAALRTRCNLSVVAITHSAAGLDASTYSDEFAVVALFVVRCVMVDIAEKPRDEGERSDA